MKSVVPFSKFHNAQSNTIRSNKSKKKIFLFKRFPRNHSLFIRSFLTLIKSKNIAIIRVRRHFNTFRSCNLYNSVSQYSQSSISLNSCYGFFQQKRNLSNKLYRVYITSKKRKIYAISKTKKQKRNNNKNKKKNFHKTVIEDIQTDNDDFGSGY